MRYHFLFSTFVLAGAMFAVGCSREPASKATDPAAKSTKTPSDELKAARDKLSAEDRKLVEAQEYCAVSTDSRLGEMGEPWKVMVKDQPVFLCCKGCQKQALANPEKTLATVVELKAKAKAESSAK